MRTATKKINKILQAILDTFTYFNVGQAVFDGNLQETAVEFIVNFFLVGFRIVLLVFACMLVIKYKISDCRYGRHNNQQNYDTDQNLDLNSDDKHIHLRNRSRQYTKHDIDQGFGRYRNFADYCAYHTDNR